MIRKIESKDMGKSNLGWLKSIFHFSFAEYYNPENIEFGALRVLNDDLIEPGEGFDTHPHRDMEILTYVIDGQLTHADSMGNKRSLSRGHVQYMSAGTGVTHSEHNLGTEILRLLQIWIKPDKKGHTPNYGDHLFEWSDRKNKLLHIASGKEGNGAIKINQDINMYVLELEKERIFEFPTEPERQLYLVQIEGQSNINSIPMNARDAMEIVEESIVIQATDKTHVMIIEMKKK